MNTTRSTIAEHLRRHLKIPKSLANAACADLLLLLVRAIETSESVQIGGFGRFSIQARAARVGRHPRTGLPLPIPATTALRFCPGPRLRNLLNDPASILPPPNV